jgi:glycosyltransferase involved in cell wall biosynthesis
MNQKKNLLYITETSLPTKSANIINSLKFCDALSDHYNINFIVPNNLLKTKLIKKKYNLKNYINFENLINKNIENFKTRIFFSIKIILKISKEKNYDLILSRSIITSLMMTLFNIRNTLELHHIPQSFSKFFFNFIMFLPQKKNLSLILINKNLAKDLRLKKLKYIVLDDAADYLSFRSDKNLNMKKKTCVYMGSFFKGKGIEIIEKLSKLLPDINFHLYGDKKTLGNRTRYQFSKNIKFFKYVDYSKIPIILKNYEVALMPFESRIEARSKNLEISKYISPLKMFDYLAAGKIIIATKLKVYQHILKNNENSFLVQSKDLNKWKVLIKSILKDPKRFKKIKMNAQKTAKKYSWDNRSKKLLNFLRKN